MAESQMNITIPGFVILCGTQGQGKSHVICYLMYMNRKKFDWGLVFCNTDFSGLSGFDYIDKRFVHPKYNEAALVNLKNIQKKAIEAGKSPSAFVIFDDCLFGDQWKSIEFQSLMTQLRHYRVTVIISTQYPNRIPPMFREQAWQAIMFRPKVARAINAQFESFGSDFDSVNDFKKFIIEHTTIKYQFVFFDATSDGDTIAERYQVLKSPANIPKFTIKFSK